MRFFRPCGAESIFTARTHGLCRGLHSCAASRLERLTARYMDYTDVQKKQLWTVSSFVEFVRKLQS
jgi:hypothetical protein